MAQDLIYQFYSEIQHFQLLTYAQFCEKNIHWIFMGRSLNYLKFMHVMAQKLENIRFPEENIFFIKKST